MDQVTLRKRRSGNGDTDTNAFSSKTSGTECLQITRRLLAPSTQLHEKPKSFPETQQAQVLLTETHKIDNTSDRNSSETLTTSSAAFIDEVMSAISMN